MLLLIVIIGVFHFVEAMQVTIHMGVNYLLLIYNIYFLVYNIK